jgi:hypothetical protein
MTLPDVYPIQGRDDLFALAEPWPEDAPTFIYVDGKLVEVIGVGWHRAQWEPLDPLMLKVKGHQAAIDDYIESLPAPYTPRRPRRRAVKVSTPTRRST